MKDLRDLRKLKVIFKKDDTLLDKDFFDYLIILNELNKIQKDYNNEKLNVRPYMHCPEIDETDEIKYEDITWVFNDTWEIDLGELVKYKIETKRRK